MISETGHRLLQQDAVSVLVNRLLPLCKVITPNAAEAAALTGIEVTDISTQRDACRKLYDMGAYCALVKGGHLPGPRATDVLYDGRYFVEYGDDRIDTRNTHGTGCTYAAAIAAFLGHQQTLPEAIRIAKQFVTEAIRRGFPLGQGAGPLNHFWPIQNEVEGKK
jgi:hydroxymethylpyrimidine kinase/phosphomethylpyrimidine kinase